MLDRVIVITRRTAFEDLLVRHHSRAQVAFFLGSRGASIEEFEGAHAAYRRSLEAVAGAIPRELTREVVPRDLLPTFLFREQDLVVAVGPDGLVVNVAKYLDGQPILGVNPDATRVDGILARWAPEAAAARLPRLLRGEFQTDAITIARAATNDGQELLAVNDILVGRRDPVSARYAITYRGRTERQSSSGVLVATGCGSTGWMRSVVTGAQAMTGGKPAIDIPFDWSASQLAFAVREPFPSKVTGTSIAVGVIRKGEELVVTSEMGEGGAIYSDGVVEDAVEFNAGTTVRIGVAAKSAKLIRP